jgi:hypothetical protein
MRLPCSTNPTANGPRNGAETLRGSGQSPWVGKENTQEYLRIFRALKQSLQVSKLCAQHYSSPRLSMRPDRPLASLGRPPRPPDKEIFEYIQVYSSIFEYIQAYSTIFKVFKKNIPKICPVCPIHVRCNGQARLPARYARCKPPNAQYDNHAHHLPRPTTERTSPTGQLPVDHGVHTCQDSLLRKLDGLLLSFKG